MLNRTVQTMVRSLMLMVWVAASVHAAQSSDAAGVTVSVTDTAGSPVVGAVVWFAAEADSRRDSDPADVVVVDQINKQFVPELTVIRTGTVVEFPNSDSVSHHVYSFAQPNSFELPLYRGGETPRIRFDHAGIVTLGCNIHDAMLGYIVVLDEANFALTDNKGIARFTRPPALDAAIHIWSPDLDATKAVLAERLASTDTLLQLRAPLRLQPQPGVAAGSLAWAEY